MNLNNQTRNHNIETGTYLYCTMLESHFALSRHIFEKIILPLILKFASNIINESLP